MYDMNINLMKDGMVKIMQAQVSYTEEVETKSGYNQAGKVKPGINQGWQPLAALVGGRKLQEPKQS